MMHRAWNSIVEVPYCFSRSYVKLHSHTALKVVEFDPNWAFPDCNSSFNSPMAMKCCKKLETAKERCPIVFQGHLSNFKVTQYLTSPILTQIGRFRTTGQSQLSNPSDLPCFFTPEHLILYTQEFAIEAHKLWGIRYHFDFIYQPYLFIHYRQNPDRVLSEFISTDQVHLELPNFYHPFIRPVLLAFDLKR